MNAAMEFHDSVIESAQLADGTLRLLFSRAYVHRSNGKPGVDAGEGWAQPVRLDFFNATISGDISTFTGKLSDGSIEYAGTHAQLISVPSSISMPIIAVLTSVSGDTLRIAASTMNCVTCGDAVHVESFGS